MAKLNIILLLVITLSFGGINRAIVNGSSLGSLDAIHLGNDYSSKEPWNSSVYYNDTTSWSFGGYSTLLNSSISAPSDEVVYELGLGTQLSYKKLITANISVSRLIAFQYYFENSGYLSLSTRVIPFIIPAVDLKAVMMGLSSDKYRNYYALLANFRLGGRVKYGLFVLSVNNIILYGRDEGAEGVDSKLNFAFHSNENLFGAQGVKFEVTNRETKTFSLTISEELRVFKYLYFTVALRSEPITVSMSVTVPFTKGLVDLSFAQVGWLGWSQSFSGLFRAY